MSDLREEIIRRISMQLYDILDIDSLRKTTDIIISCLDNYEFTQRTTEVGFCNNSNYDLMKQFAVSKAIEGLSQKSIKAYLDELKKFDIFIKKDFDKVDSGDIRKYFSYKKISGVSDRTLSNIRYDLSSFFQWLNINDIIAKNPILAIAPIKYAKEIKVAYSEVDIVKIRENCKTKRDSAMVEFFLSSACRVSELCEIKMKDIDFLQKSCIIHGKGNKYRIVYFSDTARLRLKEYIESKPEPTEYLFTSYRKPYDNIHPGGIRKALREVGLQGEIENVHPHRFRRTFATGAIDRGMPIQSVSQLLGHSDISTTQIYYDTSHRNLKNTYEHYATF